MKQQNYRQGDLYIRKIGTLPKGLTRKDNILAYGEATGHRHQFLDSSVEIYVNPSGGQFISLDHDADLVHEEHDPLHLGAGHYQVLRQREFDAIEGLRQVRD